MTSLVLSSLILALHAAVAEAHQPGSGPADAILENPAREGGERVGSSQIDPDGDALVAEPQINPEQREVRPPPQLTSPTDRAPPGQVFRGTRSAAPAEPLSRPADGRTGTVTRVGGRDRCDPAESATARGDQACANVIETRSEEFRRSEAAVLSPEQRLLIEQRARDRSSASAARRIATGAVNPDSPDDQAIAAITLDNPPPAPPPREPERELPTGADALINAIVNRIQPQN